jgi:uncharacterized protein with GYD domain
MLYRLGHYQKMKEMMSSVGAKYIATYATLGPYDFVYIIEGPDDPQKILQAEAKIAATGAVTLQTFPAIPVEEFFKLVS